MKKKRGSTLIITFIFIMGLLIFMYPMFSQYYYRNISENEIKSFHEVVKTLDDKTIDNKIELAHIYNKTLDTSLIEDPFEKSEEERALAEYARMLKVQEKIGYLEIPDINESIPVYAGTSESVLQNGLGHMEGTSLPVGGKSTHAVISGHRGLPQNKLFTDLDKMKIGDVFYFHNLKEVLAYKVDQIIEVTPDNFDNVLVVPEKDYMTLLTCTPYMINSHRLLVRGERIDYTEPISEKSVTPKSYTSFYKDIFSYALVVIVALIMIILYIRSRIKSQYGEINKINDEIKNQKK